MSKYAKKYKFINSNIIYTYPEIIKFKKIIIKKKCNDCEKYKLLEEYYKSSNSIDKFSSICKLCSNKRSRDHNKTEAGREYYKQYSKKRREQPKRIEYEKEWYKKNIDNHKKTNKKWREQNKEHVALKAKEYREKNLDKEKARIKKWQIENKERIKKVRNVTVKKRYKEDLDFKIKEVLKSHLRRALQGRSKESSVFKLLGCSLKEFKNHIESKFKKGMNWDNHGPIGWHIDHIKPLSRYDLTKKINQKKLFHYTNLQPLWWIDNIRKSNKV